MSQIHYFQRYSSIENTVTNNTLQLLARIYDYSIVKASKILTDIVDEPLQIGIEINQQEKAQDSIPDGIIIQRNFKVLIESKVNSHTDESQLLRHASSFTGESQQILLLLTREKLGKNYKGKIRDDINEQFPDVLFRNVTFEQICESLSDLFYDHETEMKAIADDYIEYCNDVNLFNQSKYLMRIVPCSQSFDLNKKYGIYFHPSDRGYTKHNYVGIYANKSVQYMWQIDAVFDVQMNEKDELEKTVVQGRDTNEYDDALKNMIQEAYDVCGYKIKKGCRFFCGQEVFPTNYKKISSGGIQGARFVNLQNQIGDFESASEAAEKLRTKTWK